MRITIECKGGDCVPKHKRIVRLTGSRFYLDRNKRKQSNRKRVAVDKRVREIQQEQAVMRMQIARNNEMIAYSEFRERYHALRLKYM